MDSAKTPMGPLLYHHQSSAQTMPHQMAQIKMLLALLKLLKNWRIMVDHLKAPLQNLETSAYPLVVAMD